MHDLMRCVGVSYERVGEPVHVKPLGLSLVHAHLQQRVLRGGWEDVQLWLTHQQFRVLP
jgi:hypothetical protein